MENEIKIKLQEILTLADEQKNHNVVIVVSALLGSLECGQDYDLANNVQQHVLNVLLPKLEEQSFLQKIKNN